jgi:hypothetical protein
MPATVTLASTTLTNRVLLTDTQVKVGSTSGLYPKTRMYADTEMMEVVSLGPDPWVNVRRGVDGTSATEHSPGATVTIGAANQFYTQDPQGAPNDAVLVSPYINVRTGTMWYSQGDFLPDGLAVRWWQAQTTTHDIGPLGVRTTTQDPTSST